MKTTTSTSTPATETLSWDEIKKAMADNYSQMLEIRLQMQETDRRMKETDRRMKKLQGLFTTQWGKLIEALTRPAALKLFKDIGINITHEYKEAHYGEYATGAMEVDVILCNTTEAVAVEVKTTCKVSDVQYFMKKMEHFKDTFHPFAQYKVYPAIAALKYDEQSDLYALKHGLFVLHVVGEGLFCLTEPKNRMVL
ncbi:MAG: hypothetical protein CW341_09935 [Bacteroidetes bacterium]|nr:hypothetical protein [Bacteroidota bacterium]